MMVSPEGGYEEFLKGRDEKQLMTAIRGLKQEIGGTYKLSQAELRVAGFDAGIPTITKVIFGIGGFFGGYETRTISLDEEHLYFDVEHSMIPEPSNLPENCGCPCTRAEFLDGIRELHMGEWRTSYMNSNVLDGTQWELTIEFSDGHKPFKTGAAMHTHIISMRCRSCLE